MGYSRRISLRMPTRLRSTRNASRKFRSPKAWDSIRIPKRYRAKRKLQPRRIRRAITHLRAILPVKRKPSFRRYRPATPHPRVSRPVRRKPGRVSRPVRRRPRRVVARPHRRARSVVRKVTFRPKTRLVKRKISRPSAKPKISLEYLRRRRNHRKGGSVSIPYPVDMGADLWRGRNRFAKKRRLMKRKKLPSTPRKKKKLVTRKAKKKSRRKTSKGFSVSFKSFIKKLNKSYNSNKRTYWIVGGLGATAIAMR